MRVKLDEVDASKDDLVDEKTTIRPAAKLLDRQQAFGYTQEDIKYLMAPMAMNGERQLVQWVTIAH